jgi:hypothetical protein
MESLVRSEEKDNGFKDVNSAIINGRHYNTEDCKISYNSMNDTTHNAHVNHHSSSTNHNHESYANDTHRVYQDGCEKIGIAASSLETAVPGAHTPIIQPPSISQQQQLYQHNQGQQAVHQHEQPKPDQVVRSAPLVPQSGRVDVTDQIMNGKIAMLSEIRRGQVRMQKTRI